MSQITPQELEGLMSQSIGTEAHHRTLTCLISDGMKAVADAAGAYWLVTDIGAYSIKQRFDDRFSMVFWLLKVKDHKADLEAWDDIPGNLLFKHHYKYTDFPEGEWKFYYQGHVLYLPSEY